MASDTRRAICEALVNEYFEARPFESGEHLSSYVIVRPRRGDLAYSLERFYEAAVSSGCYPRALRTPMGVLLYLHFPEEKKRKTLTGLALAAITLVTVYVSGYALIGETTGSGLAWTPVGYLIGLLVPLIIHELGHLAAMRRFRVPSSMPYLLPAPPLQLGFIGTFGAVINMRWLPARTRHLAIIGIAGPVAGFIAAIPVAYYGMINSVITPAEGAGVLGFAPLAFLLFPPPGVPGPGEVILLSPMAFSAYIVFFVTFLNLIPIAMLDGGHIARAALGVKGHSSLSKAFIGLLLAASLLIPGLLLFALFALAIYMMSRGYHPGAALSLDDNDAAIAVTASLFGILLVATMPVPIG